MAKESLFQLNAQLEETIQQIFEYCERSEDGSVPQELAEQYDLTLEKIKDKIEACYYAIEQLKPQEDTLKKEAQRLSKLRKAKQNSIDRIKQLVLQAVRKFGRETSTGNKEIISGSVKALFVSKPKFKVTNQHQVPRKYFPHMRIAVTVRTEHTPVIEDFVSRFQAEYGYKVDYTDELVLDEEQLRADVEAGKQVPGTELDKDAGHIRFY